MEASSFFPSVQGSPSQSGSNLSFPGVGGGQGSSPSQSGSNLSFPGVGGGQGFPSQSAGNLSFPGVGGGQGFPSQSAGNFPFKTPSASGGQEPSPFQSVGGGQGFPSQSAGNFPFKTPSASGVQDPSPFQSVGGVQDPSPFQSVGGGQEPSPFQSVGGGQEPSPFQSAQGGLYQQPPPLANYGSIATPTGPVSQQQQFGGMGNAGAFTPNIPANKERVTTDGGVAVRIQTGKTSLSAAKYANMSPEEAKRVRHEDKEKIKEKYRGASIILINRLCKIISELASANFEYRLHFKRSPPGTCLLYKTKIFGNVVITKNELELAEKLHNILLNRTIPAYFKYGRSKKSEYLTSDEKRKALKSVYRLVVIPVDSHVYVWLKNENFGSILEPKIRPYINNTHTHNELSYIFMHMSTLENLMEYLIKAAGLKYEKSQIASVVPVNELSMYKGKAFYRPTDALKIMFDSASFKVYDQPKVDVNANRVSIKFESRMPRDESELFSVNQIMSLRVQTQQQVFNQRGIPKQVKPWNGFIANSDTKIFLNIGVMTKEDMVNRFKYTHNSAVWDWDEDVLRNYFKFTSRNKTEMYDLDVYVQALKDNISAEIARSTGKTKKNAGRNMLTVDYGNI